VCALAGSASSRLGQLGNWAIGQQCGQLGYAAAVAAATRPRDPGLPAVLTRLAVDTAPTDWLPASSHLLEGGHPQSIACTFPTRCKADVGFCCGTGERRRSNAAQAAGAHGSAALLQQCFAAPRSCRAAPPIRSQASHGVMPRAAKPRACPRVTISLAEGERATHRAILDLCNLALGWGLSLEDVEVSHWGSASVRGWRAQSRHSAWPAAAAGRAQTSGPTRRQPSALVCGFGNKAAALTPGSGGPRRPSPPSNTPCHPLPGPRHT
jgi:hypothetical protein